MFIDVLTKRLIRLSLFFLLLAYILNIDAFKPENDDEEYLDIGVRLAGDHRDQLIADLIAQERDILNAGHVSGVDLYHFQIRRKRNHRSKRALDELVEDLKRDERIEYITVGERLDRRKREFFDDDKLIDRYKKYETKQQDTRKFFDDEKIDMSKFQVIFDDTLFAKQWYLENVGQFNTPPKHDINVAQAWLAGYSGKEVLVCVVDDGLDHPHPELADRYRPQFSYDLNDLNDSKHDPLPRTYDSRNNHGTECAGTAVGKANNEVCGVGVAFNADIAGIRLLDGRITTLLEARALTLFAVDTHIKSASWGPTDDGTKMEAPDHLANAALEYGVTHGRHGKGTLYVWASGNGGASDDDCGADGYVSHHNVISISSINHLGQTTFFDEACPSTMAVAYTGGRHSTMSYYDVLPVGVIASDVGGKCTTSFAGTSAAAPVAAGAFALVLEANPELGYRDVMHIIARTARIPTLDETDDWLINGAGYHVSDKFGFGVLDVGQMVALAQNWTNVQPRYECYQEYTSGSHKLDIGGMIEIPIDVTNCPNVNNMEHVIANISFKYHRRGDVKITLISPSKTSSEMLSYRNPDATHKGIQNFPFLTTHNWDESPEGRWTLRMETRLPQSSESKRSAAEYSDIGELSHFALRIYGSHDLDDGKRTVYEKRDQKLAFIPTQRELESIYKRELAARDSPNILQKRDHQKLMYQRQMQKRKENSDEEVGDNSKTHGYIAKIYTLIHRLINNVTRVVKAVTRIISSVKGFFHSKKPK